jgi:hypothetical protein
MDPNAQLQAPPPPPPPPAPSMASRWIRITIVAAALVAVVGGLTAFRILTAGPAKIVFTTTDPAGYEGCSIKNTVDTVNQGTSVWMVIDFTSKMDSSEVTVWVTKDGQDFKNWSYATSDTKGADCFGDVDPFTDLQPGKYEFTAKKGDKVEAKGTLTVK